MSKVTRKGMVILENVKHYLFLGTVVMGGLFLLIWGWIKVQETFGIFHPVPIEKEPEQTIPSDFEWITFEGQAGELSGLWKTGEPGSPVIIYFHGNAGHVLSRIEWLRTVVPDSWQGVVFDYRGYGRSDGSPSEKGIYQDGQSAVRYVRKRVRHDRILFHARSLGVPVAAKAMNIQCPKGIVFESGFPSASSMARSILPLPGMSYLMSVEFNTVDTIRSLSDSCQSVKKLVVHGRRDRIVPPSQGRKLYNRLPEPKDVRFFDDVGHNDILMRERENYRERLNTFYRSRINSRER